MMSSKERKEIEVAIRATREELQRASTLIREGGGLDQMTLEAGKSLEKVQHLAFDAKRLCYDKIEANHGCV